MSAFAPETVLSVHHFFYSVDRAVLPFHPLDSQTRILVLKKQWMS